MRRSQAPRDDNGRQRELRNIERWFVAETRRITLTGFSGQGKTYLAAEAGRWLRRTGMFDCVAFVNYSLLQGANPLGYALATVGTALGKILSDSNAAIEALKQTRTLVILDNVSELMSSPAGLAELL